MLEHTRKRITNDLDEFHFQVPREKSDQFATAVHLLLEELKLVSRSKNEEGEELFEVWELFSQNTPNENLRAIRWREDMTQKEFSKALGISQSRLSELERGKRNISVNMAKKIEKIFGVGYKVFV